MSKETSIVEGVKDNARQLLGLPDWELTLNHTAVRLILRQLLEGVADLEAAADIQECRLKAHQAKIRQWKGRAKAHTTEPLHLLWEKATFDKCGCGMLFRFHEEVQAGVCAPCIIEIGRRAKEATLTAASRKDGFYD